jgi:hypothetical protein
VTEYVPRGEPFLRPRFERALRRAGNTHSWDEVVPRLLDGRAQWWGTSDGRGALVTEILNYPRFNVVNYWLAAGEFNACLGLVPEVEAWAKTQGCIRAVGMGRPGFARLLGPTGVTVAGTAYRKELVA